MNELIKIENREGKDTVSAKELHEFLEVRRDFSTWIKQRIEKYEFVENIDFLIIKTVPLNGGIAIDYYLSIGMAKELSMVENNDKGRQARRYFIECEKKVKQLKEKPADMLDFMEYQLKLMREQDNRIKAIEAKLETRQEEYYTVAGFCSLRGLKIDVVKASAIGKKCTKLSNEYGYDVGKTHDHRYGQVNTYHAEIIDIALREVDL